MVFRGKWKGPGGISIRLTTDPLAKYVPPTATTQSSNGKRRIGALEDLGHLRMELHIKTGREGVSTRTYEESVLKKGPPVIPEFFNEGLSSLGEYYEFEIML